MGIFNFFKKKARPHAPTAQNGQLSPDGHVFIARTEQIDPDEGLEAPAWAEISFLDAKALKFWNGKATSFEIPPYYSNTSFGRNVGPALGRLLAGGYIRLCDISRNIGLKTVPELKTILNSKGLKASGRKAELVQRILDNFSPAELQRLFPVGVYEITEAGEQALSAYSIIFASQDYGFDFSYYRLLEAKAAHLGDDDTIVITRLLTEDIQNCYKTGDRAAYQRIMPKAAEFMSRSGEAGLALDTSILSFFIWTRDIEKLHLQTPQTQSYFMALNLESYARNCGLTYPQMVSQMYKTIEKVNPFGLGTKRNIDYAVSVMKAALSLK